MSIRVMSWVWDNSAAEGLDRLVLLAIADSAADDGGNAYPSVDTISKKARVHERTVQRAIRRLVAAGEVVVRRNAGQNGVNVYRIPMATRGVAESHPAQSHPRQDDTPAESPKRGGTPPPEPSLPKRTPKTTSLETRGTRIDRAWRPDQALIDSMRLEAVPDDLARRELPKFIDYWSAQPGARGRKSDWPATWRNWLRRAMESPPARGQPGTALAAAGPAVMHPRTADALTVAERLRATENAS